MSKVTGKLKIALPKKLADEYGIKVGDDVDLIASGATISIVPARGGHTAMTPEEWLRHFDCATQRQRARERARRLAPAKSREWKREELYTRGQAR